MAPADGKSGQQLYKIKLTTGRIIGPVGLDRIRLLILKNHVHGAEVARTYPEGEWLDVNRIPEIADLLLRKLQGTLAAELGTAQPSGRTISETVVLPETGPTQGPPPKAPAPPERTRPAAPPDSPENTGKAGTLPTAPRVPLGLDPTGQVDQAVPTALVQPTQAAPLSKEEPPPAAPGVETVAVAAGTEILPEPPQLDMPGAAFESEAPAMNEEAEEDEGKTMVGSLDGGGFESDADDEATRIGGMTQADLGSAQPPEFDGAMDLLPLGGAGGPPASPPGSGPPPPPIPEDNPAAQHVAQERTMMLERPGVKPPGPISKLPFLRSITLDRKTVVRMIAVGAITAMFLEPYFTTPEVSAPKQAEVLKIRPSLPAYDDGQSNPEASKKFYDQAMLRYVEDTVTGYQEAARLLHNAVSLDITNVRALAMLASTYLNLIDSSNKDENYFAVISKLIEMSRAKNVDLPETVIADVEFFVTVNQGEAAQNRIVEYTKTHQNFPIEMFYYLGYAFYSRGDFQSAARYLAQFPDNKAVSPKIFYLRGRIAEKFESTDQALLEYQKAVGLKGTHARSRLRIAYLLNASGRLRDAANHLSYLVQNTQLMSPRELALAYYLFGRLKELERDWNAALVAIEKAVSLDASNHDYQLELYALRAKVGESDPNVKQQVRMYYFLAEGEKLQKSGQYHLALTQYLQAREANLGSALPLLKIGDMFVHLNDTRNAVFNYKKAVELAPQSAMLWAKYIRSLIESYEWEEAAKAMERFRKLPGAASSADKLAGDLYAKQGLLVEALTFYRKAMGRDTIDPAVYVSYGQTLMGLQKYKEAPFFFALALRFDPLNMKAIINTAKCVAQTDSIDQAIVMLQDQLQKLGGNRAELLAAIAELQIQSGNWDKAQSNVELARDADPDFADAWKLQAQIHLHYEGVDKKAIDNALQAYKSYSDRNPSDPSGYLERYKLFIRQTKFEQAEGELARIFEIYPKYPNLHFYRGSLYAIMGNYKTAVKEFRTELEHNPANINAMLELGKVLMEHGGPKGLEEASGLFNKAMQMSPREAEPKHQAGWANFLLKNYDGARALLLSAARIDQGNPTIFKRLGLAHRAVGDHRGAAEAFRKYLELAPDAPDRAEIQRYL